MPAKPLTVAFLPVYQNPYQALLTDALQPQGVTVENHKKMPTFSWLKKAREQVDILHFHWLYGLYMQRLLTPVTWLAFRLKFQLARQLGYKIVWTSHNIVPHRMPFPPMHLAIRRLMMANADAVIAHCDYGKQELSRRFPRQKPIHIVPIGTYESVYPNTTNRAEARAKLDVDPKAFVYLFLGNITAYKGLENFVSVFQAKATDQDLLIIAGRNRSQGLVERLQNVAQADRRIRVHADFIPDGDMQYFLHAADVMVAPFQKILTSSSVIVGLCFGLPVITPALGCLPELVGDNAGILYPAGDNKAMGQALVDIKKMEMPALKQAALNISHQLQWQNIGKKTAEIYRSIL